MGQKQASVSSDTSEDTALREIWPHVLERLPPNQRMLIRRVSKYFRDLPFSNETKLVFINKCLEDDYNDYFELKFSNWKRFYVNNWKQVLSVTKLATSVTTVAFSYCDFIDIENTRSFRWLLHNLQSLHIYHTVLINEFHNMEQEERHRLALANDFALMTHSQNLYEFVYETTFKTQINQKAFQCVINENNKLRRLRLLDKNTLNYLTLDPSGHEGMWDATRFLFSINLDVLGGIGVSFWYSLINTSCETLRQFVVTWHSATPPAVIVPPEPFKRKVWDCFANLTDLRMCQLDTLPNRRNFKFRRLEILTLYFIRGFRDNVTGEHLLWIVMSHPLLKVLDFGAGFVNENSIEVISESCKLLNALIIQINFAVTDNGVNSFSSFKNLEQLTLRFGVQGAVTDHQMEQIVDNLSELRCLHHEHNDFHGLTFSAMTRKALNRDGVMHFIYEPFQEIDEETIPHNLYVMDVALSNHFFKERERPFFQDYSFWKRIYRKPMEIIA